MKNEYNKPDPTAFNAIRNIERPSDKLDDWNQDDGTSIIHTGSTSIIRLGNSKFNDKQLNKITQSDLREDAELLIGKTIDRKTLSEWEELDLFPRGEKRGKYKYYPGDAPYELCASWLLVNGSLLKCSYRKAGEIRNNYIKSRDNGTLEDWLLPFLEPGGQIPVQMMPGYFSHDQELDRYRTLFWIRYRILSQRGEDPLDFKFFIGFIKKTNLSNGQYTYEYEVTRNS